MTDVELPCRNTVNKSLVIIIIIIIYYYPASDCTEKAKDTCRGNDSVLSPCYHLITFPLEP